MPVLVDNTLIYCTKSQNFQEPFIHYCIVEIVHVVLMINMRVVPRRFGSFHPHENPVLVCNALEFL